MRVCSPDDEEEGGEDTDAVQTIVSASEDHTVRCWLSESGEETAMHGDHDDWVLDCDVMRKASSELKGTAVAVSNRLMTLWKIRTGETVRSHRLL